MTAFARAWEMPSADTFRVGCIRAFVQRHLAGCATIVDPFARNGKIGTCTNDLNPNTLAQYHMDAVAFLEMLVNEQRQFDAGIFDPPYSPRQVSECYASAGITATMRDTQTARVKADCRRLLRQLVKRGGKVLSFGWNTVGMGKGWRTDEVLLVCHGGDHNDTICMAQTHDARQQIFDLERDAIGPGDEQAHEITGAVAGV